MIFQGIKILLFPVIIIITAAGSVHSQDDINIIPYLKQIESGNVDAVKNELSYLKQEHPASPSVMFLEGVLTENGQQAVVIYQKIVDEYSDSKYADAALYRIYSYYYALGIYESAEKKLNQLKNDYPDSPYIKIAEQNPLPSNPDISQEENDVRLTDEIKQKNNLNDGNYKYTIQAGAFSKIENAQTLQGEFEKSGIYSEIKDKSVAGTIFHVVYVGRFLIENDAENFLKTINEKFELVGRVVKIPQ